MTTPVRWRPPKLIANPVYRHGLTVMVIAYLVWSVGTLEVDWSRILQGVGRAGDIFARMFPPDFARWQLLVRGVTESVQMALAASFFGMILAIPLGLCAAGNLAPKPVYLAARGIISLTRTFHEVVIAIFFVKIFGFGPLAGVLTLIVASMSFIAKMLAEDVENMAMGQVEAIRATGASQLHGAGARPVRSQTIRPVITSETTLATGSPRGSSTIAWRPWRQSSVATPRPSSTATGTAATSSSPSSKAASGCSRFAWASERPRRLCAWLSRWPGTRRSRLCSDLRRWRACWLWFTR